MPFSNPVAYNAYNYCIKQVCKDFNLEIRRADEIFSTHPVYSNIVREIRDASIIIVDITDRNPNVFYELGMAHLLKQSHTIIITQDDYKDTPFDISHFRIIKYEDSIEGKEKLESQLRKTLEILLTDYKTLYADQFELIMKVMVSAKKIHQLYTIMGIKYYPKPVKKDLPLYVKGRSPYRKSTEFHGISIEEETETFLRLEYIKSKNKLILLTETGKAFVESLEEKSFICETFLDQIFADTEE